MADRGLTWVMNTQYNVQMIFCRIVHLKPINFVNQCHPNTFNKKQKQSTISFSARKEQNFGRKYSPVTGIPAPSAETMWKDPKSSKVNRTQ